VLVVALTTGHKVGLLVMALIFIAFSLAASFLAPRYRPDFPGRGLTVFIVASFVLFALMLAAVEVFGAEGQEETASAGDLAKTAPHKAVVDTIETEWRIQLPSKTTGTLAAGQYTFHVVNRGKQAHNLTINGPDVEDVATKDLAPGESADLKVGLTTGTYDLYCSIPGHKQLGMDARLQIG
jgi:plastocyanin